MSTRSRTNDLTAVAERVPVPTEWIVARLRPSARHLLWSVLLLLVLAAAVGYAPALLPGGAVDLAVYAGAGVLALLGGVLPYLSWLARRYTITSRRVIVRRGVFVRHRREIFHTRGYAISVSRGPLQALSGCATITLASGVEELLVLRDVPAHRQLTEALAELVERSQTIRPGSGTTGPAPSAPLR